MAKAQNRPVHKMTRISPPVCEVARGSWPDRKLAKDSRPKCEMARGMWKSRNKMSLADFEGL